MQQHELRPPAGAKRPRKRVGRGDSSGHGSYSGKGIKGQKARAGGGVRPGFEGGQLPLVKKLPRIRGFTNIFKTHYSEVNVERLVEFPANTEVTPEALAQAGLIKSAKGPVKMLGRGEIGVPLVVHAHKFSQSARQKIIKAGGRVKEIA